MATVLRNHFPTEAMGYSNDSRVFTKQEKEDLYLDWRNNFLTYERFAEYYFLSEAVAKSIINEIREEWNNDN